MFRAVLLSWLAGCGFQLGGGSPAQIDSAIDADPDALADAAIDAPADAALDAPTPTCLDAWLGNTIRFAAPVALTTVNSTSFERDPFLTPDELTLYVSSARTPSVGSDTWMATRVNRMLPFAAPVLSAALSTAGNETKVSITGTGLFAVLGSDQAGGAGGVDVWETSRATLAAPWGALTRTHVMAVNGAGSDHDPMISANGLRLYMAPDSPGAQHIAVATRASLTANFGAPATIAELNSTTGDGDPSVSIDERIIVFYSSRTSAFTGGNIWYATRASAMAAFGTPRIVPDVNSNSNDGDPHLSADGCRLYFGRDGGVDDWDLYLATAQ